MSLYTFSAPLRKHGVGPLATRAVLQEGCYCGFFRKEQPTKVTVAKLEESTRSPGMLLTMLSTNLVKGRIVAQRINMQIEHTKESELQCFQSMAGGRRKGGEGAWV